MNRFMDFDDNEISVIKKALKEYQNKYEPTDYSYDLIEDLLEEISTHG